MTEPARIGVYPGTFDPITHGHLDIILRATRMLDKLIIAVAANDGKNPQFGLGQRVDMVKGEVQNLPNGLGKKVEVRSFDNLLVNFTQSVGASVIVRGLRAVTDFEYEFQMAGMNAKLKPEIETIFLMASERHQFISSRFVKEICRLGGNISQFVSPNVAERLIASFRKS